MRDGVAKEFDQERDGRNRKQRGEHKEDAAPSKEIAEDSACGLTEQLTKNLAGEKRAEHLLTAIIRDYIAEECHGERNNPSGRQSAGETCHNQHWKRICQTAERHKHRRHRGRGNNTRVLAEAVTDWPNDELHRPVCQSVDGDHNRGGPDADPEIGGYLRQQRVRDTHHRLAGERGQCQQRDGAGGAGALSG